MPITFRSRSLPQRVGDAMLAWLPLAVMTLVLAGLPFVSTYLELEPKAGTNNTVGEVIITIIFSLPMVLWCIAARSVWDHLQNHEQSVAPFWVFRHRAIFVLATVVGGAVLMAYLTGPGQNDPIEISADGIWFHIWYRLIPYMVVGIAYIFSVLYEYRLYRPHVRFHAI